MKNLNYLILLFILSGCSKQTASPTTKNIEIEPIEIVRVMVIYGKDTDDHYPFPSKALRDSIYSRLSGLYLTMSYGKHKIVIKEATNNGDFFVSSYNQPYYRKNYHRKRHVHPFGMMNEDLLYKVKAKLGDAYFEGMDMIIVVSTDGGRGWYAQGVNATGFGMLGVDFTAGGKTFGKRQGQGGITVEIGSDIGTADTSDDFLLSVNDIFWTFAHEYGHWLKLGHRSPKLGIYSLMSNRLYGNSRHPEFGPAPLDIFHIMKLGWLDETDSIRVKIIKSEVGETVVTLNQVRSQVGFVLARVDVPNSKERYYFSYHKQDANRFDGAYMGQGLLIWKKNRRRIDLMCALTPDNDKNHLDKGEDMGGLPSDFLVVKRRSQLLSEGEMASSKILRDVRKSQFPIEVTAIEELDSKMTFKIKFIKNN